MIPRVNKEYQEKLEPYIAEPSSEEGKEEIYDDDSTHVSELWEDGEITFTKNGDLYRNRNLHQSKPPLTLRTEALWEVPDGQDHKRMIILDRDKVEEILQEYADEHNIDWN